MNKLQSTRNRNLSSKQMLCCPFDDADGIASNYRIVSDNRLEGIDVVILSRHLPRGTEEIPVAIAGASTEIRTGRLLNISLKRHRLRKNVRWDNIKVNVGYKF
jgi:hypothetical protein